LYGVDGEGGGGLVNRNIEKRALPKELIKKTRAELRKQPEPEGGDEATYTGYLPSVFSAEENGSCLGKVKWSLEYVCSYSRSIVAF